MNGNTQLDLILGMLEGVKQNTSGWSALCPAHDDRRSSLSVAEGAEGRVLINCFAGCSVNEVTAALGLDLKDLFWKETRSATDEDRLRITPSRSGATPEDPLSGIGFTLSEYSELKGLPKDFLEDEGLSDVDYKGYPVVRIPYFDELGNEVAERYRGSFNGGNRFWWGPDTTLSLYGLWRLDTARARGYVVLVEGESDCHTLWHHDVPALGVPGAATWKEEWASLLDQISIIYIVLEPDNGGESVEKWIAKSDIRERVNIIRLDEHKDPSELYLNNKVDFRANWQELLDSSISWAQHSEESKAALRTAAWEDCLGIAGSPGILDQFAQNLEQQGVVGEKRAAKLIYLGMTSRLLDKPVSIAIKGPSSGGKSFVIERILKFFPDNAYIALTAMSDKALAYSDEPLKHRVLVLYEASGMGEYASYLIRSLLSEGTLRYETVQKTCNGFESRTLVREGPTGLLLTTTAISLHPENETRLLSIPVDDSPNQTRNVLLALASESAADTNLDSWHALQEWLKLGDNKVAIPFAENVAQAVPIASVRVRRDFGCVLSLVRAHALLYQAQRERDNSGRIVATIDDYAVVRELVEDLIGDMLEAVVTPIMRQTVEAVRATTAEKGQFDYVSLGEVATLLGLGKSATSRRVKAAIKRGYIHNLENKKGQPARFIIGDPLPEDQEVLPAPESLV